jgi:hypothetical protein
MKSVDGAAHGAHVGELVCWQGMPKSLTFADQYGRLSSTTSMATLTTNMTPPMTLLMMMTWSPPMAPFLLTAIMMMVMTMIMMAMTVSP